MPTEKEIAAISAAETQAIELLQAKPMEFLRNCPITPRTNKSYGQASFKMVADLATKTIKPRLRIFAQGWTSGTEFSALQLPLTPNTELADGKVSQSLSLPKSGGPSLMVTSQLTGCCIVKLPSSDPSIQCKLAHVKPNNGGTNLQTDLAKNDGYALYGKKDYPKVASVAVVAVRKGATWKFYAQEQTSTSHPSIMRTYEIFT